MCQFNVIWWQRTETLLSQLKEKEVYQNAATDNLVSIQGEESKRRRDGLPPGNQKGDSHRSPSVPLWGHMVPYHHFRLCSCAFSLKTSFYKATSVPARPQLSVT